METGSKRDEYWISIMTQYKSSGLTQKKFCEENNINHTTFRNYRYRLSTAYQTRKAKSVKPTFTSIKRVNNKPALLKLLHPSGIECSFPLDLEESALLNFLRELKSC